MDSFSETCDKILPESDDSLRPVMGVPLTAMTRAPETSTLSITLDKSRGGGGDLLRFGMGEWLEGRRRGVPAALPPAEGVDVEEEGGRSSCSSSKVLVLALEDKVLCSSTHVLIEWALEPEGAGFSISCRCGCSPSSSSGPWNRGS